MSATYRPGSDRITEQAAAVIAARLSSGVAPRPDAEVTESLRMVGIPAVSVALARADGTVAAAAWGTREVGGSEAASPSTLFQAASISKPVAATAALRLVDQGALDLDEDIDSRLVRWHVPELTGRRPTVTLRMLLSHTAGLTVDDFDGYARGLPLPDVVGVLRGEGNSDPVVVDTRPGLRWRYSGGGTTVVQLLLEDVTGRPFAELLDELVLGPAGMAGATFLQPAPQALHGQLAHGTLSDGSPVPGGWHVHPETAAAGMWCTPTDLLRWAAAIQASVAGHGLLPAPLAGQMLAEQAPGWGLGPHVRRPGQHPRFGHTGSNVGFRSVVEAGRDDGTAVAVMASGDAASHLVRSIARAVAQAEGWPDLALAPPGVKDALASPPGSRQTPPSPRRTSGVEQQQRDGRDG